MSERTPPERTGSETPAALPQVATMAAIVATLVYFPLGLAFALFAGLAGVTLEEFLTFGDGLSLLAGLVAWWLIFFAGALVYTACVFPWAERAPGTPRPK